VDSQPEDVMLQVKGFTNRLQHKGLRKRVERVIICLQLAKDVDKNASIKHRLTIHLGDDVLNRLKCQALNDQGKHVSLKSLKLQIVGTLYRIGKKLTLNFSMMLVAPCS